VSLKEKKRQRGGIIWQECKKKNHTQPRRERPTLKGKNLQKVKKVKKWGSIV